MTKQLRKIRNFIGENENTFLYRAAENSLILVGHFDDIEVVFSKHSSTSLILYNLSQYQNPAVFLIVFA